jgi:hypothetical protein
MPPDAVCMPSAIVNEISIDYSVTGDGPPALLIPPPSVREAVRRIPCGIIIASLAAGEGGLNG